MPLPPFCFSGVCVGQNVSPAPLFSRACPSMRSTVAAHGRVTHSVQQRGDAKLLVMCPCGGITRCRVREAPRRTLPVLRWRGHPSSTSWLHHCPFPQHHRRSLPIRASGCSPWRETWPHSAHPPTIFRVSFFELVAALDRDHTPSSATLPVFVELSFTLDMLWPDASIPLVNR